MAATEIAEFENIAASLSARTIAIAGGDREGDLLLYKYLREQAYVRQCILVGDETEMRQAAEGLGLELAAADIMGTGSQEETAANIHELAQSDRADQMGKYGRALVSGPGQFKPVVYWKPARRPCTGGGVSWRGGLLNGIDGKNGNDKSHLSHQSH